MSDYPEGTKRVFTEVNPHKLDIVDKGANLQVLVYKREEQEMTTKTAPKEEKPEIVQTEAVKSEDGKSSETEVQKQEVQKPEETKSKEKQLTAEDVATIVVKVLEAQKTAESTSEEKVEVQKSEEPKEASADETLAKALEVAVSKALKPLTEKVEALGSERAASAAADSDEVELEKSEGSVFGGLFKDLPK